jgi:hypothetical protein
MTAATMNARTVPGIARCMVKSLPARIVMLVRAGCDHG